MNHRKERSRRCVFLIPLLVVPLGFVLSGCVERDEEDKSSSTETPDSKSKLTIVTTCGMVTNIVAEIAGDKADVTGLIPSGDDPHLFTAGRNDVQAMMDADIIFYSGLMLEGRIADHMARVARKGKAVYPVTESIDEKLLREPPEFEGHWDPHVWMDVTLWSMAVERVAEALVEQDESNADYYRNNAKQYRAKLVELDEYIKKVIATIPEESRFLVTAHDAFGYFSEAYNIKVRAIQGISTESQASIAHINELVEFIVKNKVPAIFVESSVPRERVESVIEGCADQGFELKKGAELFSDAMGADGTYEGTYIGMMDHNATRIALALGGEAPEKGWQGKLTNEESE